jgi:hypothetical protein
MSVQSRFDAPICFHRRLASDCVYRPFVVRRGCLYLALVRVVGGLFSVAQAFLYLAFDLFSRTFDLLFRASGGFAYFALHFAGDVLRRPFDLIAVHKNLH